MPTRLLQCDRELSCGDTDAENRLVEGDNLEALKALLPHYRGLALRCLTKMPHAARCEVPTTF